LKKRGFELSSWPFTYICTYFHSWTLSSLAEMFEEIGSGCVDWKRLFPHRVQRSCEQGKELLASHKVQNFSTGWVKKSFPSTTVLQRV
jgi:hypothetical protein